MAEVLAFKPREKPDPHLVGEAICIACRRTWTAVVPEGTFWLECECGAMKGILRHRVGADEGDLEFQCDCGCEALVAYLHKGRFYLRCMGCGVDHTEAIFQ